MKLRLNLSFALYFAVWSAMRIAAETMLPSAELTALEAFYYSTNGSNWDWSPGDVHWNFSGNPNPCTEDWYGVSCKETDGVLHVDRLILSEYNLHGLIPSSISALTYLNYLFLNDNRLTGTIPSELGELNTLIQLRLYANKLSGTIPPSLGLASALQGLYLFENNLNGTIPFELGSLTQLLYLHLDSNALTGLIPPSLGNLHGLSTLDLSENRLNGTIPASLGNLISLQTLYLYDNNLNGTIPSAIGNMSALVNLALMENYLTGSIPVHIGAIPMLETLYLSENKLTGSIPSSLGNISALTILRLDNNQLNGTIPATLGRLYYLEALLLQSNKLTGIIPASFGNISALAVLYLTSNHLTGSIPPELGNLTMLIQLDIHYNSLSGTVPNSLESLTSLNHIDISFNIFTGTIPAGFSQFIYLQQIGMDDNAFTGPLTQLGANHTLLQLIQFENNHLTGTIPASYGQLLAAQNLMLNTNFLTGTLPPTLASLTQLQGIYVASNMLTGCIPRFEHLSQLQVLTLSKNAFSGNLEGVFNSSMQQQLVQVAVDYNAFTGTLPIDVFRMPLLSSFVAISNCFTGTLPGEVCTQINLQSLIFDGLHTARACRSKISMFSSAYIVKTGFHGSIPPCIFSLPLLSSLHLSGNSLTGTIPEVIPAAQFVELTLSHNLLTGTVPLAVQSHSWSLLDLSFNLLSGSLQSTLGQSSSSSFNISSITAATSYPVTTTTTIPRTIYLQNNRISGDIPSALRSMQNISILGSNLFSCQTNREDIPQYDSEKSDYECGSDSFDSPFYTLLCAGVILLVLLGWLPRSNVRHEAVICLKDTYNSWKGLSVTAWPYSCQRLHAAVYVLCRFGLCSTIAALVVLIPWYVTASEYYGTYTHQYAWAVSAAFLAGLTPGLVEFFLFSLLIVALAVATVYTGSIDNSNNSSPAKLSDLDNYDSNKINSVDTTVSASKRANIYMRFLLINLTIVVGVNVGFVTISLTQSSTMLSCAQVLMSFFKLFWNSVCIPILIQRVNIFLGERDLSTVFFGLQVFVGLFNNIAIPCAVVAVLSPSCFYNIFDPPPTVTSNYIAEGWSFAGDSGTSSFFPILAVSSYDPPFNYDYQCSSSFITYYAATFVYMALTVAIVLPCAHVIMLQLHGGSDPTSTVHKTVEALLPRILKPIVPAATSRMDHPQTATTGTTTAGVEEGTLSVLQQHKTYDLQSKLLLDGHKILVTLLTCLGILLTFGIVFPPLTVAMCAAMLSTAYFTQLHLNRLLIHAREANMLQYVSDLLEQECRGTASADKLKWGIVLIICFAAFFYPMFLFDTLGAAMGWSGAFWVFIVMPLTPPCLLAAWWCWNYTQQGKRMGDSATANTTDVAAGTSEVELKACSGLAKQVHGVTARDDPAGTANTTPTSSNREKQQGDVVVNTMHINQV